METDEAAADGEPRCPLGTLRAWAFSAFCRFGERLAEEVCEGAGERPAVFICTTRPSRSGDSLRRWSRGKL